MDGFTACPASGEGTALSTHRAFDSSVGSRQKNSAMVERIKPRVAPEKRNGSTSRCQASTPGLA